MRLRCSNWCGRTRRRPSRWPRPQRTAKGAAAAQERRRTATPCALARPVPGEPNRRLARDPEIDSDAYLAKAVAVGREGFAETSAARGDGELLKLAQLIAPMARARLGDSPNRLRHLARRRPADRRRGRASPVPDCRGRRGHERSVEDGCRQAAVGGGHEARPGTVATGRGPAPARLGRFLRRQRRWPRGAVGLPAGRRTGRGISGIRPEGGLARRACPIGRGVHQAEAICAGGRGALGVARAVSGRQAGRLPDVVGRPLLVRARSTRPKPSPRPSSCTPPIPIRPTPTRPSTWPPRAKPVWAAGTGVGHAPNDPAEYPGSPLAPKVKENVATLEKTD